ncbi:CRISPR-associated helicase Cas3' [Oscillatoria sp. CS-180]|uniref:CRISPR-associated helicase Cas3' n=1 Tax=Oscillatoria sp. CS-180 TaxID=3021720 RepID=UPI0023303BE8|nr:CRISPR-associated helicase Cas3' [Oscillatoria sp. CS-180]MDB9524384.1 CRISPR-associated helicase Cas3' [Oscillatoria sp. CS-180]
MRQPRFWAKTGKAKSENEEPRYHPVICHLADTAAVAMEIIEHHLSPIAVQRLCDGFGLPKESTIRFCGFMAGSHDLGKVSPAFQFQVSDVGKALVGDTLYDCWYHLPQIRRKNKTPHGLVTAATLPEFLVELGVGDTLTKRHAKRLAKKLAIIVGGHHGFFPASEDIKNLDGALAGVGENNIWRQHSLGIFEQLTRFVELTTEDLPSQCDNAAAMLLAGLTTVSDWLASNPDEESGFPYANDKPFGEYTADLHEKAKRALAKQGWTHHKDGDPLTFTELFGFDDPRDLQKAAIALSSELQPPCLIMVEASMGEGKTEAALYLADYLQHQTSAGGFYIGLPTQATSNAMFQRVQDFLGKRYKQEVINLTLSHSAAALKEDYQQTICRLEQVYDSESKVVASEWHTARKRSLLSPYGVGTIDQGLMGVVRSRHQFVRLFGLAGRTVILDEIHAYDLYTGTLLERFLEWLALLGSPVIALSATLPKSTREGLLEAYAKGSQDSDEPVPELPETQYPRITAFTNGTVVTQSFPASGHVCRDLGIHWVKGDDQDKEWTDALNTNLEHGGCAAVICSTVGRAQKVYECLKPYFTPKKELGLFHGRFLFADREEIEQDCLDMFGKKGKRPEKYVLVATQVIEQSLDVDFDLMISDLAPIDLLLQRSGRLHRHSGRKRPQAVDKPVLWIVEPTIKSQQKAEFRESGYIYDRHILLRSWLALQDRNQIQLPEETDSLIESVYDLDAPIPDGLEPLYQEDWQASLADYRAETEDSHRARANQVKLPPARSNSSPDQLTRQGEEDDESTIAAVTRLGEESVTTIFLQQTAEGLRLPTGEHQLINLNVRPTLPIIRDLLANSTRISKKPILKELLKPPDGWISALLRNCRYVVLNDAGVADLGKWLVVLDPLKGVVFRKKD